MRQCPFCSKVVDDNDIACQHCGRAIYRVGKIIQSEPRVKLSKEAQGEDQNKNFGSNNCMEMVFWIFFVCLGLFSIVNSYIGLHRYDIRERNPNYAVGEVVDISCWVDDYSSGCDYEIQFEIPEGGTIRFNTSSLVSAEIGEQVEVVYSLDDPQNAGIQGVGKDGLYMSILLGVVFMLMGIWGVSHNVKQS